MRFNKLTPSSTIVAMIWGLSFSLSLPAIAEEMVGILADGSEGKVSVDGNELFPSGVISGVATGVQTSKVAGAATSGSISWTTDIVDITASMRGVYLDDKSIGSEIKLGQANSLVSITAKGAAGNTTAIYGGNEGQINISGTTVSLLSEGNTTGFVRGIYANKTDVIVNATEKISLKVNSLEKSNSKSVVYGATLSKGASLKLGSDSTKEVSITVESAGENKTATTIQAQDSSVEVLGKNIFLHSNANSSTAVQILENGIAKLGNLNSAITVVSEGVNEVVGLRSEKGQLSITADKLDLSANSSSGQSVGLMVLNGSEESTLPENTSTIAITANSTLISADTAIAASSNGRAFLDTDLIINSDTAISARGQSRVDINPNNDKVVQIKGDIEFGTTEEGSGKNLDADVRLNLQGSGSYWTGNILLNYPSSLTEEQKTVDQGVTLSLNDQAQWNVTSIEEKTDSDQIIESLALNQLNLNDGIVNLTDNEQSLSIKSMSGTGGTFNLPTTVTDGQLTSGNVEIGTISSENTPQIHVNYTGITADDVKSGNLGDIKGGVTSTEGSFTQTKFVAQGAVKGAIAETYNEKGEFVSRTVTENTRLDAYGSVAALSILQWRHEMNDLTKRMGELRTSPEGIGSWARIYDSEQEYGSQNLTAKNTSVQIGADTDVGNGWKVGAAFTYTDGSADYDLGDADNKAYGLGVYGTWMADNGQFVDLIAKYSRLDTDFKLEGMNGSSDNNAFSISAEYGWHLRLGEFGFFEPQAEVTYGYIQGDKFHTSNGVEIDQDDFESLIGRIGFRTGFHFPKDKGLIYARVSGLHDFKGDFDSTATLMSDRSIYDNIGEDLGDTWVEFGIGANFNWTPNTYTYVDLERTNGGDVKENWRWNIGLRHVF